MHLNIIISTTKVIGFMSLAVFIIIIIVVVVIVVVIVVAAVVVVVVAAAVVVAAVIIIMEVSLHAKLLAWDRVFSKDLWFLDPSILSLP